MSAATPDERVLALRHDLPHAVEGRDDGRGVARPVALPRPEQGARRGVERHERAVVVAADVRDHAAAVDHAATSPRRRPATWCGGWSRSSCARPGGRSAASQAERTPVIPKREEPPVGERRRRLRALAVAGRRRVHLVGDRVGLLPELATAGEIERAHDLALALARELVDAVARDDRRGVPGADRELPAGSERLGPAGSRREARSRWPSRVRSAPLRPLEGRGRRVGLRPDEAAGT